MLTNFSAFHSGEGFTKAFDRFAATTDSLDKGTFITISRQRFNFIFVITVMYTIRALYASCFSRHSINI
jgi:hypothetical protein